MFVCAACVLQCSMTLCFPCVVTFFFLSLLGKHMHDASSRHRLKHRVLSSSIDWGNWKTEIPRVRDMWDKLDIQVALAYFGFVFDFVLGTRIYTPFNFVFSFILGALAPVHSFGKLLILRFYLHILHLYPSRYFRI